jgi:alpha-soluble NSF attachment protein
MSKSPAQALLDKADKKAASSSGWFSSATSKFEEAGDLYQQAANSFKIEKNFKEAGDAFAREAECRENCKEMNEAANAWWNAAKAYKRGFPQRELRYLPTQSISTPSSRRAGLDPDHRPSHPGRSFPAGRRPREGDRANTSPREQRSAQGM